MAARFFYFLDEKGISTGAFFVIKRVQRLTVAIEGIIQFH